MVDWKKVKCTHCKSKKRCRKESIAKGSQICQVRMKLIEPKKQETISKEHASTALLYNLYQKAKGGKKEEE